MFTAGKGSYSDKRAKTGDWTISYCPCSCKHPWAGWTEGGGGAAEGRARSPSTVWDHVGLSGGSRHRRKEAAPGRGLAKRRERVAALPGFTHANPTLQTQTSTSHWANPACGLLSQQLWKTSLGVGEGGQPRSHRVFQGKVRSRAEGTGLGPARGVPCLLKGPHLQGRACQCRGLGLKSRGG